MSRRRRFATSLLLGATVALTQVGSSLAGSGATVECGQLASYTAPDPTGPTPGSITIGLLTAWEIVPTATVSANAASVLPSSGGSGPTCLSVEFDPDGKITSLDFAPQGDITGDVTFDSGSSNYLFADRLIVPTFITDTYPGIGALFVTTSQAGTQLSVTFSVDVTTGSFTGFDGHAAFCGKAGVASGGDGKIGAARIPAAVLDPGDINALEAAGGKDACATVHAVGTVVPNGEGQIDVQTDVDITVVPPPPSTSTVDAAATGAPQGARGLLVILVLALAALVVTRPRARTP